MEYMTDIKVIDNVLDEEYFFQLQSHMTSDHWPWFFMDNITSVGGGRGTGPNPNLPYPTGDNGGSGGTKGRAVTGINHRFAQVNSGDGDLRGGTQNT